MNSECIYCGAACFGRGCPYSPTETHVHMNIDRKCIYCGSESVGSGCPHNPYGKVHIKSAEFLNRTAIQSEKSALMSYFLNVASSLIEENRVYTSPLDRLYKKIASIISLAAEPLMEAFNLRESPTYSNLSKHEMIECIDFKRKIVKNMEDLNKIVQEGSMKIPKELLENAIVDAILAVNAGKIKN
jgi:hypothetical protein